jgi:hypothetical protein
MPDIRHYLSLGHTALVPNRRQTRRDKAQAQINRALEGSNDTIVTATTVFPLTLFPDTISIDRTKMNITHRIFFWAGEVISIKLEDILNVVSTVGPFFGSVQIHTRYFDPGKPYIIKLLWRKDALRIDRIMQGYAIAKSEDIDLSALSAKELAQKLNELGKVTAEAQL